MIKRSIGGMLSLGYGLLLLCTVASAQTYPSKPVRLIVPFPAGGGADILARTVGQKVGESWGQTVVIDNRAGASGMIGTDLASKASPDGYTIVMVISSHVVASSLYTRVPYDAVKDFAPVVLIGITPNVLVVHPSLPVHSVKDVIALARSRPGQLNFASGGKGLSNHLAMERFRLEAKVDMVHVPFKGGPPSMTALVGGEVGLMFNTLGSTIPLVKAGKLRAVAISSSRRSPLMPDLPTVAESGLPGFEANEWWGILAPAGTPQEIVSRINGEIVKALRHPDVQDRLVRQLGFMIVGNSPDEFAAFLKAETPKWAKVIKDAGITPE